MNEQAGVRIFLEIRSQHSYEFWQSTARLGGIVYLAEAEKTPDTRRHLIERIISPSSTKRCKQKNPQKHGDPVCVRATDG